MDFKNRCTQFISRLWGNRVFLILLILNIVSNVAAAAVEPYDNVLTVCYILGISALSATVESIIVRLFRGTVLRRCVLSLLAALHVFMAIVDYFLIANFKMIFTADSIGILAETTPEESQAFLGTYLNLWSILLIIVAVVGVMGCAAWLARTLARKLPVALASMALALLGVFVYGQMVYNHLHEGEGGNSVSQLHAFTRLGYSAVSFRGAYENIKVMRSVNRDVTATLTRGDDAPSIILVIGESFSVYHSSLYGYSKPTNPRLAARVSDSTMVVFDDVVSPADHTGTVLRSLFMLAPDGQSSVENVLFPVCFRRAGYKTVLVDNQYFVRDGFSWLTDRPLSELMFDYRNPDRVGHDINLLGEIPDLADPQLIIVHLFGQHFTYSGRYPAQFAHFKAADYPATLTPEEREVIAHYDNATRYNDYVVDSIISKYQDKNCIVVYFSDHGEEIYEIDDFMGHGNAPKRPTINYQIRVPLMVWTSPSFRDKYPGVAQRIADARHTPVITDDLPHFLFDVAGVSTGSYRPDRSFINDRYDVSNPRIVLGNTDYDKYKPDASFKPRY